MPYEIYRRNIDKVEKFVKTVRLGETNDIVVVLDMTKVFNTYPESRIVFIY